jgi:predicted PurR-regulated permease PerM
MGMIQESFNDLENFSILENLTSTISAVIGIGTVLFRIFIAFVSSIFILFEKDKFKAFLCRVLGIFTSELVYDVILKYSQKLNKNFRQYINTQTVDGIILGTLATIALSWMGSVYFLTLGIMLGIVNYIPYFGSIFGSLIAIVVVLITQGWEMGLLSAAVLLVIQQLDANVIQPKLMGESFKFSPLLVIISVTVGNAFAGVLGMIAAIPIVAVLKDMMEDIISYFERKKKIAMEGSPKRRTTDFIDFP